MKSDIASSKRGFKVSLLGLFAQALLALAVLLYSRYTNADHATTSMAIYMGIGLIVWATLAFVFDQTRRMHQEAMEAEALGTSTSAFDESEMELRVSARRLASIQRFFVPGVSLLVAIFLIATGFVRLDSGRELLDPGVFGEGPGQRGWAITIGLATAIFGFIFARFVAGMAKQPAWTSLRAGGSFLVGSAIMGLIVVLGHFIDVAAGPDSVLRIIQVAYPIAFIVLGIEIVLNFVLDIYRPRRVGEAPRPAFDSRVLGLVAAPDRIAESLGDAINYQFGVDVTGTWFYQLLSRSILMLFALAFLIGWGLTSLVVLEPHQRGLILSFGEISNADAEPGMHVKWPWPFGEVIVPEYVQRLPDDEQYVIKTVTGVRRLNLGSNPPDPGNEPILWGEDHALEETYAIVQPSPLALGTEAGVAGTAGDDSSGGRNVSLIAVEVPMHYVVTDVERYETFASPESRDRLLRAIGQRVVMQHLAALNIDDVLAAGRADLARELRQKLTDAYAEINPDADGTPRGPGIDIVSVGVEGVHPPKEAAAVFEQVVQAGQLRQSVIEQAEARRINTLATAAGSVDLAGELIEALDEYDRLKRLGDADAIAAQEIQIQRQMESAGGQAGALLLDAGATRWARAMSERGRARLYEGQVASYNAAPALYRSKLYFQALLDVMRDARVFITPRGDDDLRVRMELQDLDTGINVFDTEAGRELSE